MHFLALQAALGASLNRKRKQKRENAAEKDIITWTAENTEKDLITWTAENTEKDIITWTSENTENLQSGDY